MTREDLGTGIRSAIGRFVPTAEALLDACLGTRAEHSPLYLLAEATLAEQRAKPTAATMLAMVIAFEHLIGDAADAGLADTAEHAACDIALEELGALFRIARTGR